MTEPGRRRPSTVSGAKRTGRGTASVVPAATVEPPDPSLRRDKFENRPVRDGAVRIAERRRHDGADHLRRWPPARGRDPTPQARDGHRPADMTPAVVGEVGPLTGPKHEVDRAAIARW